jgi:hypothetical protein
MRQVTRLTRAAHLLLCGTALLLVLHFVRFSVDAARRTSHGYLVLYTSARLVREGAYSIAPCLERSSSARRVGCAGVCLGLRGLHMLTLPHSK